MVNPRKPGESDAEYVARIGDIAVRWEQALAEADRAVVYLIMSSMLGQHGGFDADDLDGWQKRSALVRGVEHGYEYAGGALDRAAAALGIGVTDALDRLRAELLAAMQALSRFTLQQHDTLGTIPQADIDAVTTAAATVAEILKPAIENLKSQ